MNILHLTTPSHFDRHEASAWRDAALKSLRPEHDNAEVDLSATQMIDANGVAALLALNECFVAAGNRVRLTNPTANVVQLLELMGMHRVFQFATRPKTAFPNAQRPILIIEDEVIIRSVAEMAMRPLGLPVVMAENGIEGLATARRELPCIIILDYVMPLMDGEQTLLQLKLDEATRDIPVVLMSANDQVAMGNFERFKGAALFVSKPFSPTAFRHEVNRLIHGKIEEEAA